MHSLCLVNMIDKLNELQPARLSFVQGARLLRVSAQTVGPRVFTAAKRADFFLCLGQFYLSLGQVQKARMYFRRADGSARRLVHTYASHKHFTLALVYLQTAPEIGTKRDWHRVLSRRRSPLERSHQE